MTGPAAGLPHLLRHPGEAPGAGFPLGSQVVTEFVSVDGVVLVAGSSTLVETLLERDPVDELRLMVFPTILGRGKRLFPDGIDRRKLRLAEAKTVGPDGVQVHTYRRA